MKKIALNKRVIATLNDPNKITGGVTFTFEIGNTCEGQSCLCMSRGDGETWCYCGEDLPIINQSKKCDY